MSKEDQQFSGGPPFRLATCVTPNPLLTFVMWAAVKGVGGASETQCPPPNVALIVPCERKDSSQGPDAPDGQRIDLL